MKIVIVPDDKTVRIDGVSLQLNSIPFPRRIHAIHWDSVAEKGTIERVGKKEESITDFSAYKHFISDHAAKILVDEKLLADDLIAAEASKAPQDRRREEYPSIEDQLEAMYDARQGDYTKLDAIDASIAATRVKHPL